MASNFKLSISRLLNPAPDTTTTRSSAQHPPRHSPSASLVPVSRYVATSSFHSFACSSHIRHASDPTPRPVARPNQLVNTQSSLLRPQSSAGFESKDPTVIAHQAAYSRILSSDYSRAQSYSGAAPFLSPSPPYTRLSSSPTLEQYHHVTHPPSTYHKHVQIELCSPSVPFLRPLPAISPRFVALTPEREQHIYPALTMASSAAESRRDDNMDMDTVPRSELADGTSPASVNPYETDADKLSKADQVSALHPQRGRYRPRDNDFKPDPAYYHSHDDESLQYWGKVLAKCNDETRLNNPAPRKRDTFALGSVIVKCDHNSTEPTGDYSIMDENEASAIELARKVLTDIQLPVVHLRTKIHGRDVLVQSRIPGVSLEAAWPYLSQHQKESFKDQARSIAQRINGIRDGRTKPSYIVKGDNPRDEHRLQRVEYDILFGANDTSVEDLSFAHNNLVPANIIVDNDTIVGVTGWSDAGYFGWNRIKNVHHKIRSNVSATNTAVDSFWADLYDISVDQSTEAPFISSNNNLKLEIKAEQPTPGLESIPRAPTADVSAPVGEPCTPRKVTDLKRDSMSRASSADRWSPAPSTKPSPPVQSTKKRPAPSAATKKGTAARKPAPKKRKLNSNDADSVEGTASPHRRSATPVSSRASKTPANKNRHQSSLSVTGSPGPETKRPGKTNKPEEYEDDDEDEDPSQVFCICRKPDNHTWMIGCDGGCEDWFHGKCVKINQEDADLIDKYICPSCEAKHGLHTTWKRMCRLPGCRQPARIVGIVPSKYCSEEHGREFMHQNASIEGPGPASRRPPAPVFSADNPSRGSSVMVGRRRQKAVHRSDPDVEMGPNVRGRINANDEDHDDEDDTDGDEPEAENGANEVLGSRGGVLTKSDLKAVVSGVKSAQEFRGLGNNILPPPMVENATAPDEAQNDNTRQEDGIDFDLEAHKIQFTVNERQHIQNLRNKRTELCSQLDMLRDRDTFLTLVRQRAKTILELLRQADTKSSASTWKDICGFDSRLSWSDDEFNEWRLSDAGKEALRSGVLEGVAPPTAATAVDQASDTEMQDAHEDEGGDKVIDKIARGVCIKKRCERHKQWVKVQQQDIQNEERVAREELGKCEKDAKDVMGRIVLRVYGDEDNGGPGDAVAAGNARE
ncbi:hypothetical protein FQN50_003496 [Emmonsiellopsis sp. PD_5]|nr:hypothetical protein FQN50_003496 [Emmonsiellopsis sp. PD_5]